jgi:hypothetical protein
MKVLMKVQEGQPAFSIDSMQPMLLKAKTFATSSTGMMLIMGVIALVALQMFGGNKKGKIAMGYWGGEPEKQKAAKKARSQMALVTRNSVSLYIGCPQSIRKSSMRSGRVRG